jgi:hypothetical protein
MLRAAVASIRSMRQRSHSAPMSSASKLTLSLVVVLEACSRLPTCPGGEVLVSTGRGWACGALAGPVGATGAAGTGTLGSSGFTGAAGSPGLEGATGGIGPTGNAGVSGSPGATGGLGSPGYPGALAAAGSTGSAGGAGFTGSTGNGVGGSSGATGVSGSCGATGALGSSGPSGANGQLGATGEAGADAPALNLSVAANPNSVLSAVATVTWPGALESVLIGWTGGSTPLFDLTAATSPAVFPILGLSEQTSYLFQATADDAEGHVFLSGMATLTTGTLPSRLPTFVTVSGAPSGTGLTLMSLLAGGVPPSYVTIIDGTGRVVWYDEVPGDQNGSVFLQQFDGTFTVAVPVAEPLLDSAQFLQLDALGNALHTWNASGPDGTGVTTDTDGHSITIMATGEHDIATQPDGSALVWGKVAQTTDFSAQGGHSNAVGYYDVLAHVASDNKVLWAWNSAEIVTPNMFDTVADPDTETGVDVTHANALQVMRDGNYLASFRNLSSVWKINSSSGDVIWKLGGAGISLPESGGPTGDFSFVGDPLGGFSCQHGARELPNGDILLFDDGDGHSPPQSRGAEYTLDTVGGTATLVWQSTPSTSLYTSISGFSQRLSNGNTLVTYGTTQTIEEWDPTGTDVLWKLRVTSGSSAAYRAYRLASLYSGAAP